MRKNLISKDSQYCLVGKINGLSAAVKKARIRIFKAKTEESKNNRAITKLFIGNQVRHHLLAYAFLRNIPYFSVERKCRSESKPCPESILQIIQDHMVLYQMQYSNLNVDTIKEWLKGEEVTMKSKSFREITKEWAQNAV